MNNYWHPIGYVTGWIILCFTLSTQAMAELNATSQPRTIHVSGTGKASAVPDKADLTLSVEIQAKTAEAARARAAEVMDALIKAVKREGVADKDIQTRSLSLYPTYSPDIANKITGYQLANQVSVSIRDIDKTGDIVDVAVKAGGNATRVQGINFSLDDANAALTEAREKAYANAKSKADQYAKLAGVSLGAPLHISEGGTNAPPPLPYAEMRMMKAGMADSASTPIQAGEQEISLSVDVVFGID